MSYTLHARIRRRPPSHDYTGDLEGKDVHADGADYRSAKAAIDDQVPEGWQVLAYSTWPLNVDPTSPTASPSPSR